MIEFLWPAIIAGIGVAVMAGPLGAFVVWRRMAYFGDTLSHAALLGVALGIVFNTNLTVAVILCCILLAIALVALQQKRLIATDTLLGILAHSTLALGLVTISLLDGVRIDLMAYLFGDLLAVTLTDLIWIYGGALVVLALTFWLWQSLLAITIDEELAQAEGYPVPAIRLVLMLLIAIVIAVAMKIVGVLLITSLLIIPAATARRLAGSPEQMAMLGSLLGSVAVGLGVLASWQWNTPTGPSIVLAASGLFLFSYLIPQRLAH